MVRGNNSGAEWRDSKVGNEFGRPRNGVGSNPGVDTLRVVSGAGPF